MRADGRVYCDKMKDYDEEMAEYCKTDDFSCLAAPAAGQEVLALPDRAGHLRRLRGPGHLHLLCLLRRGLLDQDPHPAGTRPVVGVYNIYNIYHYLPLFTTIYLRRHHSSWAGPGGILLLGGKDSRFSSEIVSGASGNSEPGFPVHYT